MDRLVTRTLAEIYLQQGHFQEAYEMFKALLEKDPSNKEIQEKLRELIEKLKTSPTALPPGFSKSEKIRLLERWLSNIQERRKT
jgi:tetratricopeptide (TPR) repeat protein